MTSHGDRKTTRENAIQMLNSFLFFARRFGAGQWSFLGPGSEIKWWPGDGVPRRVPNRRRRTRKGPEPACVQSPFFFPFLGVAHAGGGGRMNSHPAVAPSSRRGNTSSESRWRESRAAQKG